jgi:acyl dehydratase
MAGGGAAAATAGDKRRFFEDFVVGEVFDLGTHAFDRDGVVGFAADFDPQPFHLEEAAGKASMLGGLAASGWQVTLFLNRAFEERVLAGTHVRGILAVDRIRWLRPVLAGATLTAEARVYSLAADASAGGAAADRAADAAGVVGFAVTGRDAEGRTAIEIVSRHRIARFAAAS